MRIAVAQTCPKYRDIEHNLHELERTVVSSNADLVVFPELALTGYLFTEPNQLRDIAHPLDSQLVTRLVDCARTSGRALVTGFLEEANGQYYNSSLLISPSAGVVGHYRKVHLFHFERQVFSAGDLGFPVIELPIRGGSVKIGMMICYDWRFPEAARSLALAGAEVIAVPSNIVTTTGMLEPTLCTRSFENKVILAFADRVGNESLDVNGKPASLRFRGESMIVNYNGTVLARLDDHSEGIADAEVEPEATRNKAFSDLNDIFTDRNSSAYRL